MAACVYCNTDDRTPGGICRTCRKNGGCGRCGTRNRAADGTCVTCRDYKRAERLRGIPRTCTRCGLSKLRAEFDTGPGVCKECKAELDSSGWIPNGKMLQKLSGAKHRAKRLGIAFSITVDDLTPLPHTCPVLGLELDYDCRTIQPNSPSIDRFIPEKGYVPGNVSIISNKANAMKHNGSLEEHRKLLAWMEVRWQASQV